MKLRVGIVGGGSIATPHLQAYVRNEHVNEIILCDTDEAVLQKRSEQFGIIKHTTTKYDDLLADDEIRVIGICTPHYLHHRQALKAFKAGKDVICEKPIAIKLEHADEMISQAKKARRRFFVSLNQRMFPAHRKVKELMDAGEIGTAYLGIVNIIGDEFGRMNDAKNWKGDWEKAGGGALIDTGYHAVYMLQHFFGNAKAVTAMTKRLRVEPGNKADDTSVVALEHPQNTVSTICVTYAATGSPWTEERQIIGTTGSFLIRDHPEDEIPLHAWADKEPVYPPLKVFHPPNLNGWAIEQAVGHFIECILDDKEPEIKPQEARAALATCLAAYRSQREGRRIEVKHVKA